jgi:hypothetical protein
MFDKIQGKDRLRDYNNSNEEFNQKNRVKLEANTTEAGQYQSSSNSGKLKVLRASIN